MHKLFPPGVGVTQIRGLVNILRDNSGKLEMSKLAEESDEEVDDLLPIIEASVLLGLARTGGDAVALTEDGKKFASREVQAMLRAKIVSVEPFKSVIAILRERKSATTHDLVVLLHGKKNLYRGGADEAAEQLRNVLLHWGVRVKLLSYNLKGDAWSMKRYV